MNARPFSRACMIAVAAIAAALSVGSATASAKRILLPTITEEIQMQRAIWAKHTYSAPGVLPSSGAPGSLGSLGSVGAGRPIQPPAPPCPQNGLLPSPLSGCGVAQPPATTLPFPGNMAYYGGHVQVHPHVYMVYWGWGEKGAFPAAQPCKAATITEGTTKATLRCDPDGAGRYMADFVSQLGGTQWAGEQTQYYQTVNDPSGQTYQQHIVNPSNQLGGIWVDDVNSITGLPKTSASKPPGASNTYTDLAAEAARAAAHFHVTDLANANFVIVQPPNYSDPNALATGYCAFHDYTLPGIEGGIYSHVEPGVAYTNMPYVLAINSGGSNVCGENGANSGSAGKLDGFSIALGHEIEETVTDPGAENVTGSGLSTKKYGGWYDPFDPNENGDKCAYVGESLLTGGGPPAPIPGAVNNISGNRGSRFAVQSLWSNAAAAGGGYCAGAGTDLPQPVPAQ